jgi:hypothetical protein
MLLPAFLAYLHLNCTRILFKISHLHVAAAFSRAKLSLAFSGEDGRRTTMENSNIAR